MLKGSNTILAFISAPDSGPSNLTAKATNSTAIFVTWGEIIKEKQNGVIQEYRITYIATDGSSWSEQTETVNVSVQEIQIENLRVFTEYKITVRGRTIAGFGEGSDVFQKTLEEGMLRFFELQTVVFFDFGLMLAVVDAGLRFADHDDTISSSKC